MARPALATTLAVALSVGCRGAERPPASPEQLAALRQAQARYDSLAVQFRQTLRFVGEPLKGLTEEQQASVAALVLMTRVATEQQLVGGTLLEGFWTDVPEFCPPLRSVTFSRGGCLDAEIAYASSMPRCLDEGRSEAQCEREAAGDLGAAVSCKMREIEALAGVIGRIPGRQWPPRPFPWPIEQR